MQSTAIPSGIQLPFANSGAKQTIPVASQIGIVNGRASYTDGFPPLTRTPIVAGGVPPFGTDMNGILNAATAIQQWQTAGGIFKFNSAWSTANTGYPKGAVLCNAQNDGAWLSLVENNTTDPDAAANTNWAPIDGYGSTAIALTNANVTLTPDQYAQPILTLSGTLTGNVQLIVPAIQSQWGVVNNCTGAFTVTIKTAAGTGVACAQGQMTPVYGDGTNVLTSIPVGARLLRTSVYSRVSFNGAQQVSVNGGTPTTTGASTFTALPQTTFITAELAGGGAGSGATATTSGISITGGGGGGAYALCQYNSGFASLSVTVGAGGIAGTTGGNGGNGSASSLGALVTVPGGSGSVGNTTYTSLPTTGIGIGGVAALSPTGSGFIVSGQGKQGRYGITTTGGNTLGGDGADSPFGGGGGVGSGSGQIGNPGVGYGSGAGGVSIINGTTVAGQTGAAGIVIIREYAQ